MPNQSIYFPVVFQGRYVSRVSEREGDRNVIMQTECFHYQKNTAKTRALQCVRVEAALLRMTRLCVCNYEDQVLLFLLG